MWRVRATFFFKYLNLDRDVVEVDNFFEIIF